MSGSADTGTPHPVADLSRVRSPIALFWLALAVVTNVFVPQLETVAEAHNVSLSAQDAPSLQASKRIGKVFQEFDSDSSAMIVLEGDQPLGADAHHYYDGLIQKLSADTRHVEHVDDFWGDPLTAAGHRAPTARPRWCRSTWPATRASRWPTSPSTRSAASSGTPHRRRA